MKTNNVSTSIITRDPLRMSEKADNLYAAIAVMSRRANQISVAMKEELTNKLSSFVANTDSLEEVHENREQIEVSRHYERLPKPTLLAIEEFLDDKIIFRVKTEEE